jgi:ATP-dependent helicase YprA (DUF1998 family)
MRARTLPAGQTPGEESPEACALSALHGAEHLICKFTGIVPGLWADDISGRSYGQHKAFSGGPGIFLHENVPGGTGLMDLLMEGDNLRKVIEAALNQVDPDCPNKCLEGCPNCVLDRLCGNENFYLDKEGSRLLLRGLVGAIQ